MEKVIDNPNITKEELKKKQEEVIASINKKSLEELKENLDKIPPVSQEYDETKEILKMSNVPEISRKYEFKILENDISYNAELINLDSSIRKPLEYIKQELESIKAEIKENVIKLQLEELDNDIFEDMETILIIVAITNEIEAVIKKVENSYEKLSYKAITMTDCFHIGEVCENFNELKYKMLRLANPEHLLEINKPIVIIKGNIERILDTDISFVEEELYYLEIERDFHITDSEKLKDIVTQIYSREEWDF